MFECHFHYVFAPLWTGTTTKLYLRHAAHVTLYLEILPTIENILFTLRPYRLTLKRTRTTIIFIPHVLPI